MNKRARRVVYGTYPRDDELLVFILESRAIFLADVWRAMVKAQTWGELKRLASRKAYREILRFQESPRSIRAHHGFSYEMTPVTDGDYPGFPAQEMLEWMPEDVRQKYGALGDTVINGTYLLLAKEDTESIVADLRKHGYLCREDQWLVEAAHGERAWSPSDSPPRSVP